MTSWEQPAQSMERLPFLTRHSCLLSLAATFCSLITHHSPVHTCHVPLSLGFCPGRTVSRKYKFFVPAGSLTTMEKLYPSTPGCGFEHLKEPFVVKLPIAAWILPGDLSQQQCVAIAAAEPATHTR